MRPAPRLRHLPHKRFEGEAGARPRDAHHRDGRRQPPARERIDRVAARTHPIELWLPVLVSGEGANMPENRLARETSPYLIQHKDNPVAWWPWGPEALAEATRTGKPILLSVGYAACHWCHVMAHESFEDTATASVMNELFVNIKVDREERPEIDEIYMN